jgi:hypothetical protein
MKSKNIVFLLTYLSIALFLGCSETNKKDKGGLFVVSQNGKYGYIDKTGKIVINPQFDCAENFSEGLAVVCIGRERGFIATSGKRINNDQFDSAHSFSEGLAAVRPVKFGKPECGAT